VAYLAAIVEHADDGIIGKDMSGVITFWNRGAQAILGYDADDVIGRPIQMLFPPDRLDEEEMIMARLRNGDRIEHHETVRRHKDGSDVSVSVAISPIRGRNGTIVGASKILRDITGRLKAQRALVQTALARSIAEFDASFESAAVGKVLAEPSTRTIVRVNPAFARMLGRDPDDLIGHRWTQFVAAEDKETEQEDYDSLLNNKSSAKILEIRLIDLDGAPHWVRVSASLALTPASPRPFFTVIAVEDIDARYKAQMDLVDSQRKLELVLRERTAALADRDILLREVYHRVKNNLQIIDAMMALSEHKIEDSQGRQSIKDLRTRLYALALVHRQLMGSSNLQTFDVTPFIETLCDNIFDGAAAEHIQLTVSAYPLDVGLDFAVHLGLVVTELVTNSLKHAFPDGVGAVSVVLGPNGREGVVLTVSDNGVGSSRAAAANSKEGFGSMIVKSLVTQLRGEIVVDQRAGTTTTITLPLPAAA
jgi:PAS domain S-box-containing protein